MKKLLILFVFIFFGKIANSQSDYFQQEVNYNIDVTLDDELHQLKGVATIEYINNSPNALNEIYFHLWANAYKNTSTAFAKQQVRNGSTKFFFAKDTELGGYESVRFSADGNPLEWIEHDENIDIAYLKLNKPIPSGGKTVFEIPFTIKIPNYFSRMGHKDQAYYISQWYPKPAVYDKNGWHPMPYLDQGEFYSEFGSFDVKITLPKNYVVASTGTLETESEKGFLNKKLKETEEWWTKNSLLESEPKSKKDTFPASSSISKTIHYTAENVHDFAWFADKRFLVEKSKVEIVSGKVIDTWAFYNQKNEEELWRKKATEYLNNSVKFYSENVGVYPYPHATAVNNPYSDAGAMEYPMITLVDQMEDSTYLDIVIAHEVGHNWFYGILAFNERDHAWLDEGMNSYYEKKYTKKYYPDFAFDLPKFLTPEGSHGAIKAAFISMNRRNTVQPSSLSSDELTQLNYGMGAYEKPAIAFTLLEKYLGEEKFNELFKGFYETWKFKHPQPQDFRNYLEKNSGEDLSWLFDGFISSTETTDYKVKALSGLEVCNITITNRGTLGVPFSISGMKDGKVVHTQWYDGFEGEQELLFENGNYDEIVVDQERLSLDTDYRNNTIRTSGVLKKASPIKLKLGVGLENPTKSTLYWLPALGWNNYDQLMTGLVLHNFNFLPQKFDFAIAPMYSFGSKELVGAGMVRYNAYPKSNTFQRVSLGIDLKRFSYNQDDRYGFFDNYLKVAPKLEIDFKKKSLTSSTQHSLSYRFVNITQNYGTGLDTLTLEYEENQQQYYVNELKYTFSNNKVTGPYRTSLTAQQGEGFLKIFADGKLFVPYAKRNKGGKFKFFAGAFASYDNPVTDVKFQWSGVSGFNVFQKDYLFDEILFGRNESEGILSQQIFKRDAELKTLSNAGSSTDFMIGFGGMTTIPGKIPLRPYADLAIYSATGFDGKEVKIGYSAGIAIVGLSDILEIYIPFFESTSIKDNYEVRGRDSLFKRISFLIDLKKAKQDLGKSLLF